jgi:hypothetical protein
MLLKLIQPMPSGPRYTVKKGKTPVLTVEEAHALFWMDKTSGVALNLKTGVPS